MAKTIAAVSTGNAAGGIGVIRISGDSAVQTAAKVFSAADGTPLTEVEGYRAKFGRILSGGEPIDEAVALVFRTLWNFLFTADFLSCRKRWRQCMTQAPRLPNRANLPKEHF